MTSMCVCVDFSCMYCLSSFPEESSHTAPNQENQQGTKTTNYSIPVT